MDISYLRQTVKPGKKIKLFWTFLHKTTGIRWHLGKENKVVGTCEKGETNRVGTPNKRTLLEEFKCENLKPT